MSRLAIACALIAAVFAILAALTGCQGSCPDGKSPVYSPTTHTTTCQG